MANVFESDQSLSRLAGAGTAFNAQLATNLTSQAFVATEDNVARNVPMVALTRQANATAAVAQLTNAADTYALDISQGGSFFGDGRAINIALSTAINSYGIYITEDAVMRQVPMVYLRRNSTSGAGPALSIGNYSPGNALQIYLGTNTLAKGVYIYEDNVARSTAMVSLNRQGNATGDVLHITNEGSNNSIAATHYSGNPAFHIWLGTATTGQAYYATEDNAARTAAMFEGVSGTGRTGAGFRYTMNGPGVAFYAALAASLTNQAFVVIEDNVIRTTAMFSLTRQANATGVVIDIVHGGAAAAIRTDRQGIFDLSGDGNEYWVSNADGQLNGFSGGTEALRIEDPALLGAAETSLHIWDNDNAALEQVTVGAPDSGGAGKKLLCIPN